MDFLVGTFNTPTLYTLRFDPATHALTILHRNPAIGSHSWLALSPDKTKLYATAWLEPPSIVSYSVLRPQSSEQAGAEVRFLNQKPVASRSGYVTASRTHVYSAGGPSGEAFVLEEDGQIGECVQRLNFLDDDGTNGKKEERPHGDFGGLRHGAHSVDLSPDGSKLYVADIGRNCVWTFGVDNTIRGMNEGGKQHLTGQRKEVAPRSNDGPRHTIPHPNGRVLYSLQEHTSMVDAFTVGSSDEQGGITTLEHKHGKEILIDEDDPRDFWADEVRVSKILHSKTGQPQFLWASTRGLESKTKGYVTVMELDEEGYLKEGGARWYLQTPTSGGIANAVEPAPQPVNGREYAALTDSEGGWVFVLLLEGSDDDILTLELVAKLRLEEEDVDGGVVKAATAVWL